MAVVDRAQAGKQFASSSTMHTACCDDRTWQVNGHYKPPARVAPCQGTSTLSWCVQKPNTCHLMQALPMPPGCMTICCCCHHALHQAMQTKGLLAHPAASIFQPSCMPSIVAVRRLQSAERTSLRVALLNTLANCIYYNPSLALAAMQQKEQRLLPIFATWSEVHPTLCNGLVPLSSHGRTSCQSHITVTPYDSVQKTPPHTASPRRLREAAPCHAVTVPGVRGLDTLCKSSRPGPGKAVPSCTACFPQPLCAALLSLDRQRCGFWGGQRPSLMVSMPLLIAHRIHLDTDADALFPCRLSGPSERTGSPASSPGPAS